MAFTGGAVGAWLGPGLAAKRLKDLVVASMGALVAVTVFDVLPEAKEALSWPWFLAAVASGFGVFWLIGARLAPVCPACAHGDLAESAGKSVRSSVTLLLAALTIHSLVDGLAVTVGREIRHGNDLGLLFGISFHKLPEGLALCLLLISTGFGRVRAFATTVLVESSTVAGGLLGLVALRHVSPALLGLVFAHIGGGFLYLAASATGAVHSGALQSSLTMSRAGAAGLSGEGTVGQVVERRWPAAMSAGLAFVITAGLISAIRRYVP